MHKFLTMLSHLSRVLPGHLPGFDLFPIHYFVDENMGEYWNCRELPPNLGFYQEEPRGPKTGKAWLSFYTQTGRVGWCTRPQVRDQRQVSVPWMASHDLCAFALQT